MVLPIGDINPTRRSTFMLWTLISINVSVFAYQTFGLQGCEQQAFVYRWSTIPREVLHGSPLGPTDLQTLLGPCAAAAGDKNVWVSIVTALFLHGGLAHLIGNMVFLAVFGDNVEGRLGHTRFVLFYLSGGAGASMAFLFVRGDAVVPLVGASGAIAAVLGAYLVCFPRAKVLTLAPFPLYLAAILIPGVRIVRFLLVVAVVTAPAWLLLTGWFALQTMAARDPVGDLVAYEAHVAGFLVGIVLVLVLDARRRRRGRQPFHPTRRAGT